MRLPNLEETLAIVDMIPFVAIPVNLFHIFARCVFRFDETTAYGRYLLSRAGIIDHLARSIPYLGLEIGIREIVTGRFTYAQKQAQSRQEAADLLHREHIRRADAPRVRLGLEADAPRVGLGFGLEARNRPAPALAPAIPTIYVKRSDLEKNPSRFLERASHGFDGVTFLNEDGSQQEGIDAGGLTKAFICMLSEQLRKKLISLDGSRMLTWHADAEVNYKNLGKLLSVIYAKNRYPGAGQELENKIFTGPIFSPRVFSVLQQILNPDLSEQEKIIAFANILSAPAYATYKAFLNNGSPSPEEIAEFKTYDQKMSLRGDEFYQDKTVYELKQLCLEPFQELIRSYTQLASGLSRRLRNKILSHGESVARYIFGNETPTAEELISKLSCDDEDISQQFIWIKEKIREESEKPDSTWIKRFLKSITGQSVLPAGSIIINATDQVMCRSHTCSNTLDIPISQAAHHIVDEALSPKERFLANLEILLNEDGFHIA
jgi:hypothetical protein